MRKKQKPIVKPEKKNAGKPKQQSGASFDEIVGALLKVPPHANSKFRDR